MKKILIVLLAICLIAAGCDDKCVEHVYRSTVVIDVSDTAIINQFKREGPTVAEKLAPTTMKRCEGVQIDVEAIGASIENQSSTVLFPSNGTLSSNIGNYDISDSNNAKGPALLKGLQNALDGFKAIGDNQSQIFYTLAQLLHKKKGKVIIYSDLIEFFGAVSFYKSELDFDNTYTILLKQYGMDSASTKFNGTITIVSSLEKNQDKILNARKFFKFYFNKIGVSEHQYEFVGSITQTKF
jgi:hypothetical protein